MHLVPAERAGQPSIDEHRACEAIEGLGEPGEVVAWAARFSLLSDPNRLALLLCIRHAGPISVTDLALATGMNATTVSQALRLLKTAQTVTGIRHAGPISVTDLALATGMNATTVSQALRLLKTAQTVTGIRDGRVIRYQLADPVLGAVLAMAAPAAAAHPHQHPN